MKGWLLLALLLAPLAAFGEPPAPPTRVEVVDSQNAYWIHKAFNDAILQVNSGGFNENHVEAQNSRWDSAITKIQTRPSQVIYTGGKPERPLPRLKVKR